MCVKLFPGDLSQLLPSTFHKHLYLWSDHHAKDVWWFCKKIETNQLGLVSMTIIVEMYVCNKFQNIELIRKCIGFK